jgi:hypothetical protein
MNDNDVRSILRRDLALAVSKATGRGDGVPLANERELRSFVRSMLGTERHEHAAGVVESVNLGDAGGVAGTMGIDMAFGPELDPRTHVYYERMLHETPSKIAQAAGFVAQLRKGKWRRAFIEGGSTTALGSLGAAKAVSSLVDRDVERRLCTNMPKIFDTFVARDGIVPNLLYASGETTEFDPKYGVTFPFTKKMVLAAMRGTSDEYALWCKRAVKAAWRRMLRDAWRFDCTIMTASKFSFGVGPFVGSISNAMLKAAYCSCALRLSMHVDGSKLLMNGDLPAEFSKEASSPSVGLAELCSLIYAWWLDPSDHVEVARILAIAGLDFPSLWSVASRNPCVRLGLDGDVLRSARRGMEDVALPHSWAMCVEQVLRRRGGEVNVFVSQTSGETEDTFMDRLDTAIREGNEVLSRFRSPVMIGAPQPKKVRVDMGHFRVAGYERVSDVVVCDCPMLLRTGRDVPNPVETVPCRGWK